MRTTLARILLVPAVAVAAITFAAPAAQAAPPASAQSVLHNDNDSGQWGGGQGNSHYWHDDNDGILDSLFQCGLLSLLLGGCDPD